jgi:hypothetical protein
MNTFETWVFKALRTFFAFWIVVRKWFRTLLPLATTTYYTSEWYMYTPDGNLYVLEPAYTEDRPIAVEEVTRHRPDGRVDTKHAIWYKDQLRPSYQHADLFAINVPPPWLEVRCDDVDYTEMMSRYICKGNVLTPAFFQCLSATGTWYYMDPKTFEETEIPSTGITI